MAQKTKEELQEENKALAAKLSEKEEKEQQLVEEIEAMQDRDFKAVDGVVAGTNIRVMTPDEYREYSSERGLIMGRRPDVKTNCSIEELRALINSKWTPSMVMEKHGLNAEDLKQLVWKLSKKEMREKPIKYSIERDFFDRGA